MISIWWVEVSVYLVLADSRVRLDRSVMVPVIRDEDTGRTWVHPDFEGFRCPR